MKSSSVETGASNRRLDHSNYMEGNSGSLRLLGVLFDLQSLAFSSAELGT
jgi:hypothetical protein